MNARNRLPRKFPEQNHKEETNKNAENNVWLNDNNKSLPDDDNDASSASPYWIVTDDDYG